MPQLYKHACVPRAPGLTTASRISQPCLLALRSVGGITFDGKLQLLAFCLFEVMVGVFWPSMMTMRRWALRGGARG